MTRALANLAPTRENYSFVSAEIISPDEIDPLRVSVKWEPKGRDHWERQLSRQAMSAFGFRSENGILVAYGDMYGEGAESNPASKNASLGFTAVHPDHRGLGFARDILEERVREADRQGVSYLYSTIMPANTMPHVYYELGFVPDEFGYQTGGGEQFLVRHRPL